MTQWLKLNKIKFLDSTHQSFSNNIFCVGSAKLRIFPLFPLVLVNGINMTSFLAHDFQICILFRTLTLQKFQLLKVVFGRFYRQLRKAQWWCHHDVMLFGIWKSQICKLTIGYHPSKFRIYWLSGSNFMEVSVRHQNTTMTSFLVAEILN